MVQYAAAALAREPRKPLPSLEEIQLHRKLAEAMMQEGTSSAPVQHWTQGLSRVGDAMMGAWREKQARQERQSLDTDANDTMMNLYKPQSVTGGIPPVPASAMQPQAQPSQEEASVGRFAQPGLMQGRVAQALSGDPRAPASIRNNNPGAMWPGPSSQKFGANGEQTIGGGNKIATFADPVQGAAAQFDLLSRKYAGMPLAAAITKWSGGNSSPEYVQSIAQATGLDPRQPLTPELLNDPRVAVPLAKAMSRVEAGRDFPLDDQKWAEAHQMAIGGPQQAAQPQMAQGQPQLPQTADASQGQGLDRETMARMLANPLTRDAAQKMILQQADPNRGMDTTLKQLEIQKAQQELANGGARVAPGYRMAPNGHDMEAIPGGPADLKRQTAQQKDIGSMIATDGAMSQLATTANRLLTHPGLGGITGIKGMLPNIPGGNAADAQAQLQVLKSQVAFGALQAMRDASKTGGALGAVSEKELSLLQNALQPLDTAQSYEQFQSALKDIIKYTEEAKDRARGTYNRIYGDEPQAAPTMAPQAPAAGGGATHIWNPQTGRLEAVGGR